jgi:hypothetical protein
MQNYYLVLYNAFTNIEKMRVNSIFRIIIYVDLLFLKFKFFLFFFGC